MWPTVDTELIKIQRGLALAAPEPWVPPSAPLSTPPGPLFTPPAPLSTPPGPLFTPPAPLAIGAAVVVFPRHQTGRGARGDPAWAAAAVLRGRRVLAEATIATTAAAPYEPGLLALREGPCLEAAVRALPLAPDVLLLDATGRDHPRRAGLALHLGAVTGLPSVGVTHRPLLADGVWPPDEAGAYTPLRLDGECVGAWVRTRVGARPLAVHPGWRTTLETAIEVVLGAVQAHRTPEPLRRARHLARVARAANGKQEATSSPENYGCARPTDTKE
jgi:deoxyribonuclease V